MSKWFVVVAMLWASAVSAQVYKSIGPDGKVIYSDKPPEAAKEVTPMNIKGAPLTDESDPLKAAVMVHAIDQTVESFHQFCLREEPDVAQAVSQAREKWGAQHSALIGKARSILQTELSEEQRYNLTATLRLAETDVLQQLKRATKAQRTEMCKAWPARSMSPELNLMGKLKLVAAVMDFKPGAKKR
ncbi:DUF4124 domain-containing protein [Viridibacterium curvum]|uniref:DUF4124 domain-containing protein n=1 Tax=Viridibacterium curvum TaxID=1101404 RepID=A0ABP9QJK2_9RHOO